MRYPFPEFPVFLPDIFMDEESIPFPVFPICPEDIPENPSITPKELASKLSITVGEALAILEGYEPKS